MTIVKQISLFDIQELLDLESSRRFDAIFSTFDVQSIFHLFSKKRRCVAHHVNVIMVR